MNKKELKRFYKENPKPMGIYQVKNLSNGKILIGGAMDVKGKINSCKFQLENGSHFNKELQQDYNKAGDSNFSFEIIDILETKDIPETDYEQELQTLLDMWIEKLQPFDDKGYNKRTPKK
jgi:chromosome condensin MukBEF complex kleisin-like MukF subunit